MPTPEQNWNIAFWQVWKGTFIPALQAVTPQESGQLVRSIEPRFENGIFFVKFRKQGFYWSFQAGLAEQYERVLKAHLPAMVAYATAQSRYDTTVRIVAPVFRSDPS